MLKPNSPVTTNLIKARELIADKKNWCQDVMFRGKQMCAVGAVYRVVEQCSEEIIILESASKELFDDPVIAKVNDNLGHAAVMRMFERAIALSLVSA